MNGMERNDFLLVSGNKGRNERGILSGKNWVRRGVRGIIDLCMNV